MHILSCFIQLKIVLFISCVFLIFFQNAGSQLCFRFFFKQSKTSKNVILTCTMPIGPPFSYRYGLMVLRSAVNHLSTYEMYAGTKAKCTLIMPKSNYHCQFWLVLFSIKQLKLYNNIAQLSKIRQSLVMIH